MVPGAPAIPGQGDTTGRRIEDWESPDDRGFGRMDKPADEAPEQRWWKIPPREAGIARALWVVTMGAVLTGLGAGPVLAITSNAPP